MLAIRSWRCFATRTGCRGAPATAVARSGVSLAGRLEYNRCKAQTASVEMSSSFCRGTAALTTPRRHRMSVPNVAISSAPPPPHVRHSPQSSPASEFELADPIGDSPHELQDVRCPLCHQDHHIKLLLQHVNQAHPDVNRGHCRKVVRARYQMYEQALDAHGVARPASDSGGGGGAGGGGRTQVTGFPCRHCPPSGSVIFTSVDRVMKHIERYHPEVDLDVEEPPKRATWDDKLLASMRMRYDEARNASVIAVGAAALGATASDLLSPPRLRLSSVSQVDVPDGMIPPPPPTPARGATVSDAARSASGDVGTAVSPNLSAEDSFPCELCGKVFSSEIQILQHLELSHPLEASAPLVGDEVAPSAPSSSSPPSPLPPPSVSETTESALTSADAASAHIRRLIVSAYVPSTNARITVRCDQCPTTGKVFTSESALFSHMVFKHPEVVQPADKVRDLVRCAAANSTTTSAGDSTEAAIRLEGGALAADETGGGATHVSVGPAAVFPCPHCRRVFATQASLFSHVQGKHGSGDATGSPIVDGAAAPAYIPSMLLPVTTTSLWWCNACERGFGGPRSLFGHLTTKHQLSSHPLLCPACRRVCNDIFALHEHVSLQHKTLDASIYDIEEFFRCNHCQRGFLSSAELDIHVSKHHRPREQGDATSSWKPVG